MYLFERYMKTLMSYVKNYARPEACMAEGYLAAESIAFCLEFLQTSVPVLESVKCNKDVDSDDHLLEGCPIHKAAEVTLSDKEHDIAHIYVLMNMEVVNPYVDMHLEDLQDKDVHCRRNQTLLWKLHGERFPQWLKEKIPTNSKDHSTKLSG